MSVMKELACKYDDFISSVPGTLPTFTVEEWDALDLDKQSRMLSKHNVCPFCNGALRIKGQATMNSVGWEVSCKQCRYIFEEV